MTQRFITFSVPGVPIEQGNHKIGGHGRYRRIYDSHQTELKPWRQEIVAEIKYSYSGPVLTGPLGMHITCIFPRLKGHYGTGRNEGVLKANAATWKATSPDADKLFRAVGDAVTISGRIYHDDAQLSSISADKLYGDWPGVDVVIWEL